MTNWLPDIGGGQGPLYVRLAERIEGDIGSGALPPGAKLPPQRNLAFDIGVTIGTVGRAYALLRERGLVNGEVGRGTYVLERGEAQPVDAPGAPDMPAGTRPILVSPGKLVMDSTAAPEVGQAAILEPLVAQIAREHPNEISSYTRKIPPSWLEAGSRWLSNGGWAPDPASIVPTLGGHAGLLAVIAAVTAPGDKVVFEQLTYCSLARSANMIGRRSLTVGADDEGVDPAEFEKLCAQQHPKIAFLVPGLQNPTLTIMPERRRREIVEIARRHNVWLIEDAIYSALMEEQPTPIAALAPERTFHVGSLSKTVAAGIRGGWVACPPHHAPRVLTSYKMLTGGKPFLLADLSARLVVSGAADTLRNRVREELGSRERMAREVFAGHDFRSHPCAPFLWMKLPEPWLSATFKQAAANEGVLVDDEDEFKIARSERNFHRIRVGFSAPPKREDVAEGFAKLRSLLDNPIVGYDSYG